MSTYDIITLNIRAHVFRDSKICHQTKIVIRSASINIARFDYTHRTHAVSYVNPASLKSRTNVHSYFIAIENLNYFNKHNTNVINYFSDQYEQFDVVRHRIVHV